MKNSRDYRKRFRKASRVICSNNCKRWSKGGMTSIWEAIWPFLDPMDSVCLRTATVKWNVWGSYGPHGELFFLPDAERASNDARY